MSGDVGSKRERWQALFDHVLGNQATWIADIGLRAGLFRAIADAGFAGVRAADQPLPTRFVVLAEK